MLNINKTKICQYIFVTIANDLKQTRVELQEYLHTRVKPE